MWHLYKQSGNFCCIVLSMKFVENGGHAPSVLTDSYDYVGTLKRC